MFIIGDIWTIITVKLIGGVLKLAWFLTRTAFYLAIFLILSFGAGVLTLLRGRHARAGTGEYSGDGLYWRDRASGQLYHVHATETETCEVLGADRGIDWRRSSLSRLARGPAMIRCQFGAVTDGTAQAAGSVGFSRHARRGIHHLDDLDPRTAEPEITDMTEPLVWVGDRARAATALEQLDALLRARGWEHRGASGAHWYANRYQRPVILWDQPVQAAEAAASPTPAP